MIAGSMPSMDTATAFTSDHEGDHWVPVSPRLVTARRIVLVVSLVPITAIVLGVLTLLGVVTWVSVVICCRCTDRSAVGVVAHRPTGALVCLLRTRR